MVISFVFHYIWQFWLISYKNYSKFSKRKWKKHHYVYCNYNGISAIYINSNSTVEGMKSINDKLDVNYYLVISYPQQCYTEINLNHWYVIIIAIHEVFYNRGRMAHHTSTYKMNTI